MQLAIESYYVDSPSSIKAGLLTRVQGRRRRKGRMIRVRTQGQTTENSDGDNDVDELG